MTKEKVDELKAYIDEIAKTHQDITIEINRSIPETISDNGFPVILSQWITETLTIKSRFYLDTKE